MSEEDRMIYFIEGLQLKMRKHVQREKPKTFVSSCICEQ